MEKPLRCAIYLRVSTKLQRLTEQFRQLCRLAESRGYRVVRIYRERKSAFKDRPAHRRLMNDSAMRRHDVVLCWTIDRFARSLSELLHCVEKLDGRGVKFVSLREPAIDTTTAAGKLILSVMGAVAEFERSRLRERVMAGLEGAKRRGVKSGRPRIEFSTEDVNRWRSEGVPAAEMARRLNVSDSTIRRFLKTQQG
jgi:DNA invertase Pin-like site-specific DNA recombinase